MKAKLIYCSHCKDITLQLPVDETRTEYKCHCGTTNKRQTNDEADKDSENKNGKQGKD